MGENRISTHKLIESFCMKLRVTYNFMLDITKPLLKHYCLGKSEESKIKMLVNIDGDKKGIRREYITMVREPGKFTELDRTMLAIAVACSSWFPGKSDMILEEIKGFVPNADELIYILNNAYLDSKGMTDSVMMNKLHLSKGTFDRRKKDAIVLYGAFILDYAIGREKEDIEKGLINPPDFEL